jgi:uncharacterized protein YggT (Ycf19 family)
MSSGLLRAARVIVAVIYAVVFAYVVILGIAFVLLLLGASPTASFAEWIYRASSRIMEPFRGLFPNQQVNGDSVFDASLLFAVVIYSMLALLLHAGISWMSDRIYASAQQQQQFRPSTGLGGRPDDIPSDRYPASVPGQQTEADRSRR